MDNLTYEELRIKHESLQEDMIAMMKTDLSIIKKLEEKNKKLEEKNKKLMEKVKKFEEEDEEKEISFYLHLPRGSEAAGWNDAEDDRLKWLVAQHGEGDWALISSNLVVAGPPTGRAPVRNRSAKACQTRYRHHRAYKAYAHQLHVEAVAHQRDRELRDARPRDARRMEELARMAM
jgi:hypothetical protein